MESGSIIEDLIQTEELTNQEILVSLIADDDNLDMKTHILKPKQLAALKTVTTLLGDAPLSKEVIENFINIYLRYMVSFRRMSRTEIIKALSHALLEESEIKKRSALTSNLKDV